MLIISEYGNRTNKIYWWFLSKLTLKTEPRKSRKLEENFIFLKCSVKCSELLLKLSISFRGTLHLQEQGLTFKLNSLHFLHFIVLF